MQIFQTAMHINPNVDIWVNIQTKPEHVAAARFLQAEFFRCPAKYQVIYIAESLEMQ